MVADSVCGHFLTRQLSGDSSESSGCGWAPSESSSRSSEDAPCLTLLAGLRLAVRLRAPCALDRWT